MASAVEKKRDAATGDIEHDDDVDPKANLHSVQDAQAASAAEHSTTFKQAIRESWKAAAWSAIISLTIVMEGYDQSLMSNFFGYPTFQRKFGSYYPEKDTWQLTGGWQSGLQSGTNACVVLGGFINGWASSKYGYRRTMRVALALMTGFIFISFFAVRVEMLLVGQMLCGFTWGVYATTGPAYASEVCPLALRGYLTVYINLCWAMGQFLGAGVLRGMLEYDTEWSWRVPLAIQWMWPVPIMIAIAYAPESPWWLAKKGRYEEAERALTRLSTRTREECRNTLAQIRHTIQLESEIQSGQGYLDCFRGSNLRRTEICMVVFAGQQLAGAAFAYTPTYFFLQAGVDTKNSYSISIGSTAMAFIGTCISWILISYFGRRTLYASGIAALSCCLMIVGICSAASTKAAAMWAQVSFVLVWKLIYSLTVGPIAYAIISETSAVQLRPQTVVIARNTYACVQIIGNILNPYMLNPIEWNWKGKAGFFWAGVAGLTATWSYFRLPEMKDRTYEELDVLFDKKINARKFAETDVDAYAEGRGLAKS
ncbi:related to transporter (major facilitator superfamily) [Cephalotrichum gorgonifer]|uniref:Related to transporter (Major facilitator superfamily) n=1 Tax=Cephalotrichum gorgonifer TaxID=2041049 RepID=A0AAE8N000_9PEZI|nr:related to transporter (major facilitator superfamily) [Cephalotrichum gorgonifer]